MNNRHRFFAMRRYIIPAALFCATFAIVQLRSAMPADPSDQDPVHEWAVTRSAPGEVGASRSARPTRNGPDHHGPDHHGPDHHGHAVTSLAARQGFGRPATSGDQPRRSTDRGDHSAIGPLTRDRSVDGPRDRFDVADINQDSLVSRHTSGASAATTSAVRR